MNTNREIKDEIWEHNKLWDYVRLVNALTTENLEDKEASRLTNLYHHSVEAFDIAFSVLRSSRRLHKNDFIIGDVFLDGRSLTYRVEQTLVFHCLLLWKNVKNLGN